MQAKIDFKASFTKTQWRDPGIFEGGADEKNRAKGVRDGTKNANF